MTGSAQSGCAVWKDAYSGEIILEDGHFFRMPYLWDFC